MGHDTIDPSVTMVELEKGPNKQITEMFLRPTNGRQGLGTGSKNIHCSAWKEGQGT